ncbi:helix-turn-helix domain-containing protein [Bombella sp. ESL0385]|nr:helix-turn-helix domain-containing protein [Bombella sp. ESL0385]
MILCEENGSISSWIRENREAHGWTKSALARAVGVCPAMIIRYESGRAVPREQRIKHLAQLFSTPIEIIGEDEQKCKFCGAIKKLDAFSKDRHYKSGRGKTCYVCTNQKRKLHYSVNNKRKKKERARRFPIFKGYGLPDTRL